MGNPYAQRVAPPALKRKASPTKVGRAAVAERELQALKKQSRKTRALYKGWQRQLEEVTEPDAEFLDSVLTLAETAGSLAASSSEWELGKLSDDSAFADVVENRIDAVLLRAAEPLTAEPTAEPGPAGAAPSALTQELAGAEPTPAGAAPSALTQELAQARAELATASGALDATLATALSVKTAPASTVDFELSRFAEPPQPPIEAPLTNASIKFAESFGHPRRTRASTKPSYHKIEAALALKKKRPASSEANSILRASRRKGLTLQVIPFGDEASSPKTRNRKGASRKDPPKTREEARKRRREQDLRDAFYDRAKAIPDLDRDGGLIDGPGACKVNRAGNPRRVPDFARDFWTANPATAPDAIAFGLALHTFSLVEGSGGGAGLSVEALRDRAPVEDRKVVCKEELETLSSKADIESAARRAARHAAHKRDGVVLQPRLHDGTSQEGKKLFGSSAPGADAAEGASLLDLKAYGRERKGFQSTSRFDAHHGLEEHASVYTLQCFYRKRAERRNALAIKIARWYLYHDARYTHREMRKAEIAAAKKIQVFVKEVIRKTRLKIDTRKKLAMMLSRTLRFYWLRKVSHRNWKRLQREKRDWAGSSIVLFVRACRRRYWLKKRQEATLGRAQIVISQKWRTRLQSKEFQEMRSETKARLLTNKMKSYGAAARFQRAWRNYAQYIYFPCVYAMQKFFRACWMLKKIRRQRLAASVMQTFPRMVLGMNKMKDRKRAVVAFERQRCGKEEEFAQSQAQEALAEIDAKLSKRSSDVRRLLKEASKELVTRAKSTSIEAGPSPWDDEAAQEMPEFTEPLPAIHVPPNQKPGWCSRRVAPEEPSSPQPANAAKMAAPPPVAPSTPRWRPNLTPEEKELRAISADRKLATKVARRAKRQILKRMSKEERAAYDAHLLKLGKVGEWAPEHHEEQKKQRKKEDRLISKRERARDKRLIRESKRARAYEQKRRKRAINRVKNDIKRTSRNQKNWPKVHADAAFAVALFTRNGGLTEERLRLACAGLQKVRAPTSKVQPYAHNEPPRPRTVRREKLLGTEEATHWLADVAAEARPYHPRFRFEHRTRFSGIVNAAARYKVRMDARDAKYKEALAEFREVNPPRHACAKCGMPFALLDDLKQHNVDGCPHVDAFWQAEKHRLPDPNEEEYVTESSSDDEEEEFEEPAVIEGATVEESADRPGTTASERPGTTASTASRPKTKAERRAQREQKERDHLNRQTRKERDLKTREGRSRKLSFGEASRATDPSRRARMTKAERRKRDDEARELFLSKWSLPDGSKTVYKEEELAEALCPWVGQRPALLPVGHRLADARVTYASREPRPVTQPVRSGNKWMWG